MGTRLLIILLLLCATPLFARDFTDDKPLPADIANGAEEPEVAPDDSSISGLIVRAGAGLLIVALVTAGGVWLLRRSPNMRKYFGNAGVVRVLTRTYLGSKTSVFLLKVGNRVVLLGSSPAGLNALSEITDPTEVTRLVAETEAAKPQPEFRAALREKLSTTEVQPQRRDRLDTSAPTRAVRAAPVSDTESARRLAAIRAELERITTQKAGT